MQINIVKQDFSSDIENNYSGAFDNVSFMGGSKTNLSVDLLFQENEIMDKNLEVLKNAIQIKFNNDINLFSKAMGVPVSIVFDYLEGRSVVPQELSDKASKLQKGERVQIDIQNSGAATINNITGGDGMINYFPGSSDKEIKKLEDEIKKLEKIIQDKKCD